MRDRLTASPPVLSPQPSAEQVVLLIWHYSHTIIIMIMIFIIIIIMVTGRSDETTPGKPRPLGAAWLGQERQQGGGAHHHHHLLSQQYHYKDIHFVNSTLLTLVETYL